MDLVGSVGNSARYPLARGISPADAGAGWILLRRIDRAAQREIKCRPIPRSRSIRFLVAAFPVFRRRAKSLDRQSPFRRQNCVEPVRRGQLRGGLRDHEKIDRESYARLDRVRSRCH